MVKRYKENEIDELAQILKNDGVISVPTDTVYGLCARINSEVAYNKLMAVKKRPKNKLLPIMCYNKEQIKDIAIINLKAEKIIDAFMPGPITVILKKKPGIPDYINNGSETIAIRMATSKALEKLIRKTESPVFMSSANKSGEPTCTSLDEIEKMCLNLDGMMEGKVLFSKESTIVDCTLEPIKILRLGPISLEQIEEIVKR